jgi:hypothetical protein
MSDDYNDTNFEDEYWENEYYYELYEIEESETGYASGLNISGAFWIWLIVLIVICNVIPDFGTAFILISLGCWVVSRIIK